MKVEHVAPGLLRVSLLPFDAVNVYLLDDILVDSGTRLHGRRLLSIISGRTIRAVALTHGHPDHQGSAHYVCARLGIPLWCGEGDRAAVERGKQSDLYADPQGFASWVSHWLAGSSHPVSRMLKEGDTIGSFQVLETPGHTSGHLSYWRKSDRILIIGDVLFHQDPVTFKAGLREPFKFATIDPTANRNSARRLAALNPKVICFGHGPPLRHGERFREFVFSLPR